MSFHAARVVSSETDPMARPSTLVNSKPIEVPAFMLLSRGLDVTPVACPRHGQLGPLWAGLASYVVASLTLFAVNGRVWLREVLRALFANKVARFTHPFGARAAKNGVIVDNADESRAGARDVLDPESEC